MTESPAFRALSDVVLAIASEREVEPVLQRLVHAARELGGARYAALGVPDGEGAFARFITSGMSEKLIDALGPLPRTHGLLGAMLESPEPYRIDDIHEDPRFRGWWPSAHPDMRSFLGVPIVARGRVIGAVYLTEKLGGASFSDDDQRLIGLLAAHAAIAIENARLNERTRELSIVEERNRLARELHDTSAAAVRAGLAAEAAATLLARDPAPRPSSSGGCASSRRRRDGGAARADLRAAPGVARGGGPADVAAQARRLLERVSRPRRRAAVGTRRGCRARGRARCSGSPRRRSKRAAPRRGRAHRGAARGQRDGTLVLSVADDGARFDPDAPRGARAPARADLDGGARPRRSAGTLAIDSAARRRHPRAARGAGVIRVLIADDHAVVRQGLRTFLDLQDDIEVVGEAADGERRSPRPSGLRRTSC